jgi:Putative phage tail protein
MGLLRQHQNSGNIPYYTGLQIQTSGNNVPISIVWGANKIAPNCIWTGGFYGYYGYPEGSHGGGKGGRGSGSAQAKSWQYYTSWEMGLCEGPIYGLGSIWLGQNATNLYGADIWAVYNGTQDQTPWPILSAYYPDQALSYHGVAYITSYNFYLGSSANLPQYSMEVFGVLFNSSGINGGDADPAQIIQDFLINPQYGVGFQPASIDATTLFSNSFSSVVTISTGSPAVVSWPTSALPNGTPIVFFTTGTLPTGLTPGAIYCIVNSTTGSFGVAATPGGTPVSTSGSQFGMHTAYTGDSSYQGYCRASYLALSPALTNQESANTILERWLKLTNTAAVWSGGKLKFIPYGDTVVGPTRNQFLSNGVVFTPNVTPVYALSDSDFIHQHGKDPVEVTRIDPYSNYNWQRLQIQYRISSWLPITTPNPWVYWQAENSYVPSPIDVWDQNAIETYGLRVAPDIIASEICDPQVGQVAANSFCSVGFISATIIGSRFHSSIVCLSQWTY